MKEPWMSPSLIQWDSFVKQNSKKTPGGTCLTPECTLANWWVVPPLACAEWSGMQPLNGWLTRTKYVWKTEEENCPLCLVNPKCPIGLKWFQLVVLGLRLCRGWLPAPSPSDCSCSTWNELMHMPPATVCKHYNTMAHQLYAHINTLTRLWHLLF